VGFGRRARIEPEAMIGLSGISLGGYLTSLVASLDDLACAILGVPAVDLVDLVDRHAGSHPHDPVRQTIRLAKPIGRMMSPFALTPRVPMQGRFIDAGVTDRLVHLREQVTRLWEHWGQTRDSLVPRRSNRRGAVVLTRLTSKVQSVAGIGTAVWDIRRLLSWIRSQPHRVLSLATRAGRSGQPGNVEPSCERSQPRPWCQYLWHEGTQRHHRDGHRSDPRPGSYERRLRCHSLIRRSGPQ
jgi:hypothetical protein